MSDALRPCPYCAHEKCYVDEYDDQRGEGFAVWCDECGAHGPVDMTAEIAAHKWNIRYGHEAPTHVLMDWKH